MSSDGARAAFPDARTVLDAWRASGADRIDPIRFHFLDALDRRAAAYAGPARQLLDERLNALLQAYAAAVEAAGEHEDAPSTLDAALLRDAAEAVDAVNAADADHALAASPLAGLIDYIANPIAQGDPDIRDALGLRGAYPELPMLDYFRAIWSRVSADRQVRQSQEQVHKNAGPLNSNQLVHRALSLMREVSPGYLQQFLSYTDALMWMEQMTAATAPPAKETPRAGAAKKTTRGKARKEPKESKDAIQPSQSV
ncbi:DUF2894 domain-containing protein [Achromobacter arsenitoxydans]|uniref:DUF2894 domain-containing protein n=1 Tax=Achromobacter arsenitoxydans SY8 TaxID=477184 RepID=H0F177_9BURK|nr:DUF2894 domain-containing protein [Achromobacter arsenitoxydans]EHK67982.1 hypothetical protein KYC_02554 [Achromobacter arsenitoxydans SY8]